MHKRNLVILAVIGLAITVITAVIGVVILPTITHSADLPERIGTSKLSGGTLTNYCTEGWKSSGTSVRAIAVALDGTLWFATDSLKGNEGIFHFDGQEWDNLPGWEHKKSTWPATSTLFVAGLREKE
jgi:hypothetical protein